MAQITTTLRRLFNEIDYAQRRSLELRTGVALGSDKPLRAARGQVAKLDVTGR